MHYLLNSILWTKWHYYWQIISHAKMRDWTKHCCLIETLLLYNYNLSESEIVSFWLRWVNHCWTIAHMNRTHLCGVNWNLTCLVSLINYLLIVIHQSLLIRHHKFVSHFWRVPFGNNKRVPTHSAHPTSITKPQENRKKSKNTPTTKNFFGIIMRAS